MTGPVPVEVQVADLRRELDALIDALVCAFYAAGRPVPPSLRTPRPDLRVIRGQAT